jgi:hypothetical protein
MVLTAPTIFLITNINITDQENLDLQREVDLTERTIRNASGRLRFNTLFNARIIGNPPSDPMTSNTLTDVQTAYRDAFVNAGYLVTRDGDTGLWRLSWEDSGVEGLVSVYSIRTTLTPGAIAGATIAAIDAFFNGQVPAAKSQTSVINSGMGGDVNENQFGAVLSVFYEYLAVVRQQDRLIDHSAALRTNLIGTPLGYTNIPSNVFVYKLV